MKTKSKKQARRYKVDSWPFKFYKAHHRDGREGIVMFGDKPDHICAKLAINGYLGQEVIELNGSGIGVNLFLPETKLDAWQSLALCDDAWDKTVDGPGQRAAFDLAYLRRRAKKRGELITT